MGINWPPATAPPWPPAEIPGGFEAGDLPSLMHALVYAGELGFTQEAPTGAEQTAFFDAARCDQNHRVVGRILVSPGGVRFPFAVCNNSGHRSCLVLWPPYDLGNLTGVE